MSIICSGLVYATWVQVPEEARRWCGMLWSCNCRHLSGNWRGFWEHSCDPLQEQQTYLTMNHLSSPYTCVFIHICDNVTLSFITQSFCYTFSLSCLYSLENLLLVTNAGEHNSWQWKILVTFMFCHCMFMFLKVGMWGLLHARQEFYPWEYSSAVPELKLWIRRYFKKKIIIIKVMLCSSYLGF